MTEYWPGTRVIVFNARIYKDDKKTPLSMTMQKATVIKWYGQKTIYGQYSNLIAVQFDGEATVSNGHFADHVEII